jgi:hypothetical protein
LRKALDDNPQKRMQWTIIAILSSYGNLKKKALIFASGGVLKIPALPF